MRLNRLNKIARKRKVVRARTKQHLEGTERNEVQEHNARELEALETMQRALKKSGLVP